MGQAARRDKLGMLLTAAQQRPCCLSTLGHRPLHCLSCCVLDDKQTNKQTGRFPCQAKQMVDAIVERRQASCRTACLGLHMGT